MYSLLWGKNKLSILKNGEEVKTYGINRWDNKKDCLATKRAVEYVEKKLKISNWDIVWKE